MPFSRRSFLAATGLGVVAAVTGKGLERAVSLPAAPADPWESFRALFDLDPNKVHLAGMLLASHPRPVREALERHRRGLDENPVVYLTRHNRSEESEVRRQAARYLGAREDEIALVGSTTEGLALVYGGLTLRPDQEILTTPHDHYATRRSLDFLSERTGAPIRRVALYRSLDELHDLDERGLADAIVEAIGPKTRLLALTWVHSNTGLKLPAARIGAAVRRLNQGRKEQDRVILVFDGVHALGVEDFEVRQLGCDVLVAGTHKWLFGPRGTGIVWAHPRVHDAIKPTIPTFTRRAGWGGRLTPGGFHSFEHRWAVAQAFDMHLRLGKANVTRRIHELNRRFKEGLDDLPLATLHTPKDERLSAGMVCFSVDGLSPGKVISQLEERGVIASRTPYTPPLARVSPAVFNTPEEIDRAIEALRRVG